MDKKGAHSFMDDIELPQPDTEDLRGRQSVRATFKLSSRAIEALSIVAVHLGIKQKSLFDHLIEDVQTLNTIAQEIEADHFRTMGRVQKTFVISRRTLVCLDEISKAVQGAARCAGGVLDPATAAGDHARARETSQAQETAR